MQIVPPSQKPPVPTALVRLKAMVVTGLAVVWIFASVGVAVYDLSPQFNPWGAIRIAIWVTQFLLLAAAVAFWMFERPRQLKVDGLLEPPVIHNS